MTELEIDVNQVLKTAQASLYDGQINEAIALLNNLLSKHPDLPDALYMLAVCYRYNKNTSDAFETLNKLATTSPEFGRGFQEQAHLHREMGAKDKALRAYQQACATNPGLEASWRGQAALLAEAGHSAEAQQAMAQAERLTALPKELFAVTNLIHEGKVLQAENLCRAFLLKNKTHVEGMRLLAEIGSRLGVLEEAEFLLEKALEFEPSNIQVKLDYIQVLRKRQKFEAALKHAKKLHEEDPENPVFQSHYAIESLQVNDFDTALVQFDKVLEKLPNDASTLASRGHALKTIGKHDEAVQSYRKAYLAQPSHGDAYYALANLKTYRFTDDELDRMVKQESDPYTLYTSRTQLCFALGKVYEDCGDYAQSFTYYERGNNLKHKQNRYDADQMEAELDAQKEVCTKDLFEKHSGSGHDAADPIFIVGLPRAGSTLIEQILASHSQVDGTLELPNILALSHRLRDRQKISAESSYPKVLHTLDSETLQSLGQNFIDETRIHRKSAPFFTDKMPNNFRHIGLIKLILPNAKIIDARRDPMACCFSGFKQLFAEGQEFTYGLEEVGRYYKDYVGVMDHWDSVLPDQILRVHYEDVVSDLETQVNRILDYCALPFEKGCIDFHQTKRAVRTASSEQVRQPIFSTGLNYWENYASYLDPLTSALGDTVDNWRR